MRQVTGIAFLSTLALVMGGCGLLGGGEDSTANSSNPTATAPSAQSPTPQAFETPVVEGQRKPTPTPAKEQPRVTAVTPPELIAPTDPNQRRLQVQKEKQQGGTDPFGVLPIPPNPPEIDANSPAAVTPTTPSVERAVPQVPQLPVAQPPTLRIGTTNQPQTGIPQLPGASIPQPPTLRVGNNGNRGVTQSPRVNAPGVINTTPQRPVAPRTRITRPNRGQPQQKPTFGLGKAPQPSLPGSSQIRVAQRSQRTQQVASRVAQGRQRTQQVASRVARSQNTQAPNRTVARIPQRPSSTNRTVARIPQRPSSTNRTVARTPQRPSSTNRTVATQPRTINRNTVAQARPQNTSQAPTTTPTPTPSATPTTPPVITPPAPPVIPTLPPAPDPVLAKAVEVSGVVIVGNEPQAILKAPNEATSRYVRVGQRLSNGQVLVKRIEVYEGSEPLVILEQNGVEVSKAVGERPPAPAQPGSQPTTPQATV